MPKDLSKIANSAPAEWQDLIDLPVDFIKPNKDLPRRGDITTLYLPMDRAPQLITLSKTVEGKLHTVYLLGGCHLAIEDWTRVLPSEIFQELDCFATEVTWCLTEDQSEAQLRQLALEAYGVDIPESESVFSFEQELKRRIFARECRTRWHALESRLPVHIEAELQEQERRAKEEALQGFNKIIYNKFLFFKIDNALSRPLVKTMQERDKEMSDSLVAYSGKYQRTLAAVGRHHLPGMLQSLLAQGFNLDAVQSFNQEDFTHSRTP